MADFVLPAGAPHGVADWRDSAELPRRKSAGNDGYFERRAKPVTMLAIHHTADESSIQAANRYHTQQKNWCAPPETCYAPHLAYHFYIDAAGMLYWCNHLWERTWHASYANDEAIAICLIGNLNLHPPHTNQLRSLEWITRILRAYFRLDVARVHGHGELIAYGNSTSCPGSTLLQMVKAYRAGYAFHALPEPVIPAVPTYEQLGGFTALAGSGNIPTAGAYETVTTIQYQEHSKADMLYIPESGKVFREQRTS